MGHAGRSDRTGDPVAEERVLLPELPGTAAHAREGLGGGDPSQMRAFGREAYVHGVSTRSVDDLVKAMGAGGVSKSEVSRLAGEIDERVNA